MKIIGVGKNYKGLLKEGEEIKEPIIFFKQDNAILKNNKPFYHPNISKQINYEVELIIRIDKAGKNIAEKFAHKYYSEYALGIDFTAVDLITEARNNGLPWDLAKGFNDSLPISEIRQKSELGDVQNTNISLLINGLEVQNENTSQMVFTVDQIIAYVSKFMHLKKGDLILTGTPIGANSIKVGDRLEGFVNDQKLLDFEIR